MPKKQVFYFVDVTPVQPNTFLPYKDIFYHEAYDPQTLNRGSFDDIRKSYAEKFTGTPWEGVMWGTSYDLISPRRCLKLNFSLESKT